MPFEEDLRRQFETLTERIRDEVTRQLAIASSDLTASVEADRAAAAQQAASEARAAAEREVAALQAASDARAAAEHEAAARSSEAIAAAEREAAVRSSEAIAAAEREAAVRSSEAIAAAAESAQKTGQEEGRRDGLAQGQQEGREDARAEARATELAARKRLINAVRAMDRARSLSEILDTLATWAGGEAARVGVMLVRGGGLRGWRFIGFGPVLEDASSFDVPLAEAGIIADAVRTGEAASADSGPGATAPSFAGLPPGREMLAVPVPMSGQVVAVLYADQAGNKPDGEANGPEPPVAWPAVLEVLARHAARCLEAMTAFRAAQVLTEQHDAGRPGPPGSPSNAFATPEIADLSAARGTVEAGSGGAAEEAKKRADEDEAARRYARLLVSEIKLYHESAVIAGRRDRDVAVRLGGEIARARVLYEQRVPAHIRRATDHFHAELVQTLADGDPSLLGQTT